MHKGFHGHPRPRPPAQPEPERFVRVRISLLAVPAGTALLRGDTVISATHLASLIPFVPGPGKTGSWAFNLTPDAPSGGQLLLEILG